jgi:hypothetical protein
VFPEGTTVSAITYGGAPILTSDIDLGGRKVVYLSELVDEAIPARNSIVGHDGRTDVWVITISALESFTADITIRAVVSNTDFRTEYTYGESTVHVDIQL